MSFTLEHVLHIALLDDVPRAMLCYRCTRKKHCCSIVVSQSLISAASVASTLHPSPDFAKSYTQNGNGERSQKAQKLGNKRRRKWHRRTTTMSRKREGTKAFVKQEAREKERKLVVVRRLFVHIVEGSNSSAHVNNTLDSSHRSQGLGIPASFLS
jgi:hypothetical protein